MIPRRTLLELRALYRLEPRLVDIYVEGRTDRVLIEFVLQSTRAKVLEIDQVDIPPGYIDALGLNRGSNRSRVVALACWLDDEIPKDIPASVRCVIDTDFDRILGTEIPTARFLRRSDHTCVEAYWFRADHLEKYRLLALHDVGSLADRDLHAELAPVLAEAFLLRAAAAFLNADIASLDPSRSCTQSSGAISFNRDDFVTRWLNKSGRMDLRTAIEEHVTILRVELTDDPRDSLHGHDFVELLAWYVRPHITPNALADPEVVARMLACCCETASMTGYPLFQELHALAAA